MEEKQYAYKLNKELNEMFRDLFLKNLGSPRRILTLMKIASNQRKASNIRMEWESKGTHIPPFLIFSITNKCNLACANCYVAAQGRDKSIEMKTEKIKSVLGEAKELGISIILLSGGEPLTHKDIFSVTEKFPEIMFALFTNGLMVDESIINKFTSQRNVVPILSIEGYEQETDSRRGKGVAGKIEKLSEDLRKNGIMFGVSLTVTGQNYDSVFDESYVKKMVKAGCRVFFFVEYVPVEPGTDKLIVPAEKQAEINKKIEYFRSKYKALFFSFPSGETEYGGCLAAGRGFVHISADGSIEPCPFAPVSDVNLNNVTLKEALKSKLLETIRNNHARLNETKGGCALWQNRQWLNSL